MAVAGFVKHTSGQVFRIKIRKLFWMCLAILKVKILSKVLVGLWV